MKASCPCAQPRMSSVCRHHLCAGGGTAGADGGHGAQLQPLVSVLARDGVLLLEWGVSRSGQRLHCAAICASSLCPAFVPVTLPARPPACCRLLSDAGAAARASMSRIEQEAAELAGRPFNLASPQQLAEVLYNVLKVRPTV